MRKEIEKIIKNFNFLIGNEGETETLEQGYGTQQVVNLTDKICSLFIKRFADIKKRFLNRTVEKPCNLLMELDQLIRELKK